MKSVGKLVQLARLTGTEWTILIRAGVLLPAIAFGLRVVGFNRLRALLGKVLPDGGVRLSGDREKSLVVVTTRMVGIASRHGFPRVTCLPRSLTLWRLLRSQGVEADLRIGVRREAGRLDAHAWVEHRGLPLNDASDVAERYAAFDGSAVLL
jgi:hypothetical protein